MLAGVLVCIVIQVRASGPKRRLATISDAREESTKPVLPPVVNGSLAPQDDGPSVKLVTLGPGGFEPRELASSKSRFILMIDNLTGLDDILVQLSRSGAGSAQGSRVHEVRMRSGRTNWTDSFDLDPGEYVLTEATHPGWDCKITVKN